ncbi:pyridoxamine 5'-phosphate oxidase [Microthyrium microscopicum]|uniref:pyridoxal 5'-phosphate synthase n=1 Tax=Microthyrium microscopicum TaxID=703497 RepID=A0A6A6UKV4_9PEZI|nr:pyridoxamine 5'-phosphate oxidase [Microthyrium microscopicum]
MALNPQPTASKSTSSTTSSAPTVSLPGAPQAAQFSKGSLDRSALASDPTTQFTSWFAEASSVPQHEACTLATAELPSGRVSARMVYMKSLDHGFVVYSNWGTSRKAADIASNPNASLVFWWRELERQVRVEGRIERVSTAESQKYFDTRIRGSRVGAWASQQSSVLSGREELEGQVKDVERKFEGVDEIPVPEFWGGARVVPERVEFWQGRESRLHDRFSYVRDGEGWRIERLSP